MAQNYEHIRGLKELDDFLTSLPDQVARRIAFSALHAGAAVVREEIEKSAPVFQPNDKTPNPKHTAGFLKSQINKVGTNKRGYAATVLVGPSPAALICDFKNPAVCLGFG